VDTSERGIISIIKIKQITVQNIAARTEAVTPQLGWLLGWGRGVIAYGLAAAQIFII